MNQALKTVHQIRLNNLHTLLAECGGGRGAAQRLSERSGVAPALLSQIINRVPLESGATREIGDQTARNLEAGMGRPVGWMDNEHMPTDLEFDTFLTDCVRPDSGQRHPVREEISRRIMEAIESDGSPSVRSWALARGLDVRQVQRMIDAEHTASVDTIMQLAEVLGVQPGDLLSPAAREPEDDDLAARIQTLMAETGMSTTEVGRAAGVSRSAVAQWLGKTSTPIGTLRASSALALERSTGYSSQWLCTGEGPKRVQKHPDTTPPDEKLYRAYGSGRDDERADVIEYLERIGQLDAAALIKAHRHLA